MHEQLFRSFLLLLRNTTTKCAVLVVPVHWEIDMLTLLFTAPRDVFMNGPAHHRFVVSFSINNKNLFRIFWFFCCYFSFRFNESELWNDFSLFDRKKHFSCVLRIKSYISLRFHTFFMQIRVQLRSHKTSVCLHCRFDQKITENDTIIKTLLPTSIIIVDQLQATSNICCCWKYWTAIYKLVFT